MIGMSHDFWNSLIITSHQAWKFKNRVTYQIKWVLDNGKLHEKLIFNQNAVLHENLGVF